MTLALVKAMSLNKSGKVTAVCRLFEGKKAAERTSSNFKSDPELKIVRMIGTEEAAACSLGTA